MVTIFMTVEFMWNITARFGVIRNRDGENYLKRKFVGLCQNVPQSKKKNKRLGSK